MIIGTLEIFKIGTIEKIISEYFDREIQSDFVEMVKNVLLRDLSRRGTKKSGHILCDERLIKSHNV